MQLFFVFIVSFNRFLYSEIWASKMLASIRCGRNLGKQNFIIGKVQF